MHNCEECKNCFACSVCDYSVSINDKRCVEVAKKLRGINSKWISCEEELPETGKKVLVAYHIKHQNEKIQLYDVAYYDQLGWSIPGANRTVTHWQYFDGISQ